MNSDKLIYINKGVSQDERLLSALLPENTKIDDRSFLKLISFIEKYASLLNYYKYDSQSGSLKKDGDWSFFVNNPFFRIAEIASRRSDKFNEELILIIKTFQQAEDLSKPNKNKTVELEFLKKESVSQMIYALRLLFDLVVTLFTEINDWVKSAERLPEDFVQKLIGLVESKLSALLIETEVWAKFYENNANRTGYVYFKANTLKSFDKQYWIEDPSIRNNKKRKIEEQDGYEKSDFDLLINSYKYVVEIGQKVLNYYSKLVSIANTTFNRYLENKSDLKPDIGLLVSFLKLFQNAQNKINGLTEKHLDFYYKEALKFEENGITPDKTFLIFNLVPEAQGFELKKGVAFDAGKDKNGNSIIYNSIENVVLNQIQIAELKTLYIAANSLAQPQPPSKDKTPSLPFITGVYKANHAIPQLSNGFKLFGEDQFMYSESQQTMETSILGFAISSPAFFLSNGKRTISVSLNFTESSFIENFVNKINNLSANLIDGNGNKLTFDEVFNKLFFKSISVSATGSKNWFLVSTSNVSYSISPNPQIIITLFIDSFEEPIVAYNTKIHGTSCTTPYPVFEFRLNNNYPYYVYNFLKDLELRTISVVCDVKEFKNLALYNQQSLIDSSKPFEPFGLRPEKNSSYLLIGSNEIFIKNVTDINVNIDWQSIPLTKDFKSYYADYKIDPPFTNDAFQIKCSFLNKNRWIVPDTFSPIFYLYNTDSNGALTSNSNFKMTPLSDAIKKTLIDPSALNLPLKYDKNTSDAFFKLELCSPDYGFGNSLYSSVLSSVLMENAKSQLTPSLNSVIKDLEGGNAETNTIKPLPNVPFTPVANNIYVNYKAEDKIDLTPGVPSVDGYEPFYYLDTFKTYSTSFFKRQNFEDHKNIKSSSENDKKISGYPLILPEYMANSGYLFIGLKNVIAPQSLTIFFKLSEENVEASLNNLPKLTWSYLSHDDWKNFTPDLNLHDNTNGLIKSGIVSLKIPQDITNNNNVMPDNLVWIRIQSDFADQTNVFGNLTSIYTQAVEVMYDNTGNVQRDSLVLPALTIKKAVELIPQVKLITQPFPSTGGLLKESKNLFYTRVSERLRHKNRAIIPWDYERLILQNFPKVYKIKIIPSTSQRNTCNNVAAGNIDIVVIPKINSELINSKDISILEPTFGFTVLEEIKSFISQFTSIHAKITIHNPIYERIKVKCKVVFQDNNPFFIKKLNDDINSFLTPWIEGNALAYNIGNGIQKSTILSFIQQLDYVKFVTGFSIIKISKIKGAYHFYDSAVGIEPSQDDDEKGNDPNISDDLLYALTPYSVFVPEKNHLIYTIDKEKYFKPEALFINELTIEGDFIIAKSKKETNAKQKTGLLKNERYSKLDSDTQDDILYLI
jgi:hypothetical protein